MDSHSSAPLAGFHVADHAADCVKGEIHNVLAQMRLNSRSFLFLQTVLWGSPSARQTATVADDKRES